MNGIGRPNPDAPPFDEGIDGNSAARVRPGIGIARHSFTVFRRLAADGYARETSDE
jgi:hypothetical protein